MIGGVLHTVMYVGSLDNWFLNTLPLFFPADFPAVFFCFGIRAPNPTPIQKSGFLSRNKSTAQIPPQAIAWGGGPVNHPKNSFRIF